MSRVGIITFHASFNYGSMLQAYALQTFLHMKGHDVEFINYRSHFQKQIYYKPFDIHSKYSLLSSLKRLLLYPSSIKELTKKWYLFDEFLSHNLCVSSSEYNSIDELKQAHFNYDIVVVGSDQIWNSNAPDSGEAYFAGFLPSSVDKVAYGPSFGQTPENNNVDVIRSFLKGFKAISVREERSRKFLQDNNIASDVDVVCDPTLLLSAHEYEKLIQDEPLIKGEYIFFYTPVGLPKEYFVIVNNLAEKLSIPVYTERAYYPHDLRKFANIKNFPAVGPCEFLNLVKNAKYVCGGSFHLQVFSILFKKDFYCINGDQDSRTNNLLTKLGLESRIISLIKPQIGIPHKITNYESVFEKLKAYRSHSIEFIDKWIN